MLFKGQLSTLYKDGESLVPYLAIHLSGLRVKSKSVQPNNTWNSQLQTHQMFFFFY